MNAISTALKDAGVKLPPLNKRVWLWLHDHPGKTAKEIAVALNAKYSDTATQLNSMNNRGMVERVETVKQQRGQGERSRAYVYTTKGNRYELRPLKKVQKVKADTRPFVVVPNPIFTTVPSAAPGVTTTAAPPTTKGFDIEACTLRELRAMYVQLKELFE